MAWRVGGIKNHIVLNIVSMNEIKIWDRLNFSSEIPALINHHFQKISHSLLMMIKTQREINCVIAQA